MRKKRTPVSKKPSDSIMEYWQQWDGAMRENDYNSALKIRKLAEVIFKSNRQLVQSYPPDKMKSKFTWCWFLVFINETSRKNLIESIQQGKEPEYSDLYPPFNRENYPVQFF